MKMPTTVRVGPHDIPIRTLDAAGAEKNFGEFHSEHMEIRMRPAFASTQQAAETALHEVMHAVWHLAGCQAKDGEERLVTVISTYLCAVIKYNPELISWMQEALKKR